MIPAPDPVLQERLSTAESLVLLLASAVCDADKAWTLAVFVIFRFSSVLTFIGGRSLCVSLSLSESVFVTFCFCLVSVCSCFGCFCFFVF